MARPTFLKFNGRIRRSFARELMSTDVDDASFTVLFRNYWDMEIVDRKLVNYALNERDLFLAVHRRESQIADDGLVYFAEAVGNMDQMDANDIHRLVDRLCVAMDFWCFPEDRHAAIKFCDRVLIELSKRGLDGERELLENTRRRHKF